MGKTKKVRKPIKSTPVSAGTSSKQFYPKKEKKNENILKEAISIPFILMALPLLYLYIGVLTLMRKVKRVE